ncbi:serine/threonine-protein kinase PEPKR2 [Tanacetum coccineum]
MEQSQRLTDSESELGFEEESRKISKKKKKDWHLKNSGKGDENGEEKMNRSDMNIGMCFNELNSSHKKLVVLWKHMITASADVAAILLRILQFEYCHDMGVVHLDVKPKNTHLTFSGKTKLADFGMEVRVTNVKYEFGYFTVNTLLHVVLLNGLIVVENLAAARMTSSHAVGRLSGQYGFGDDRTKQKVRFYF